MTAPPRKEVCCCEKVFQELLSASDFPLSVRAYRCADDLLVQRFQVAPPVERLYHPLVCRTVPRCGYSPFTVCHAARGCCRCRDCNRARHDCRHRHPQHGPQSQGGLPDRQQHPDVLLGYHYGRDVHAAVRRHRSGQGLSDAHSRARYVLHAVCRAQRHAQAAPARQERL